MSGEEIPKCDVQVALRLERFDAAENYSGRLEHA